MFPLPRGTSHSVASLAEFRTLRGGRRYWVRWGGRPRRHLLENVSFSLHGGPFRSYGADQSLLLQERFSTVGARRSCELGPFGRRAAGAFSLARAERLPGPAAGRPLTPNRPSSDDSHVKRNRRLTRRPRIGSAASPTRPRSARRCESPRGSGQVDGHGERLGTGATRRGSIGGGADVRLADDRSAPRSKNGAEAGRPSRRDRGARAVRPLATPTRPWSASPVELNPGNLLTSNGSRKTSLPQKGTTGRGVAPPSEAWPRTLGPSNDCGGRPHAVEAVPRPTPGTRARRADHDSGGRGGRRNRPTSRAAKVRSEFTEPPGSAGAFAEGLPIPAAGRLPPVELNPCPAAFLFADRGWPDSVAKPGQPDQAPPLSTPLTAFQRERAGPNMTGRDRVRTVESVGKRSTI